MKDRFFPDWSSKEMTIWTLVGVFLMYIVLSGCDASDSSQAMSHSECTIKLQQLCRSTNEKLVEETSNFHSSHNNTVMCRYVKETLRCVAKRLYVCADWFTSAINDYFMSPYDCKLSTEEVIEIQQIKNNQTKTEKPDVRGKSSTSKNTDDVTTDPPNPIAGQSTTKTNLNKNMEDTVTETHGDNESGYTVANTHGEKSKHTGNGSPSGLTHSCLFLTMTALISSIISTVLVL